MEQYLQKCKLLGTIDIPFLAKISETEEWDSLFYELFELLASVNKTTEEFFIYNKDRLFFLKKKNIPEIEIRESSDFFNKNQGNEIILIINRDQKSEHSVLAPKIINYLEQNQVDFQIFDHLHDANLEYKDIVKVISITRHS